MITAAKLPSTHITTIAENTIPPAGPNNTAPAIATNAPSDVTFSNGIRYQNIPLTRIYTAVTDTTPSANARGSVFVGSRTSPAILVASHHPPNEKNADTIAMPSAGAS